MRFPTHEWADILQVNSCVVGLRQRRIEEACAAESRADFSHKLSICLKELRESRCWIRLIIKTEMLPEHRMGELLDECTQLCISLANQ
jgi:four helix bundle protein